MKRIVMIMTIVLVGLFANGGKAHAESPWYDGCITKYYGAGEGYNAEHGNDLSCFSYGTPVTALRPGIVTAAQWTSFGQYTITWRLDNPSSARGSPYAYFTDLSGMAVWTGEHITAGQTIGYSLEWVEFGLTPDWSYGISNWRWGVDSLFLIQEAQNGTPLESGTATPTATPQVATPTEEPRLSPPVVVAKWSTASGITGSTIQSIYRLWKYNYIRERMLSEGRMTNDQTNYVSTHRSAY